MILNRHGTYICWSLRAGCYDDRYPFREHPLYGTNSKPKGLQSVSILDQLSPLPMFFYEEKNGATAFGLIPMELGTI